MIGNPAGMKTLVVVSWEGYTMILDLRAAFDRRIVDCPGLVRDDATDEPALNELCDAAPNLALNVKNATAPAHELWLWAALGVFLQFAAVAMPAVTTYHWKWEKAGSPVASYGYPCFLIGSCLVVMGVMICGHVIEGITDEHNFFPSKAAAFESPRPPIQQIIRLQRSCTVGDQRFPSFAIYNSHGDRTIRTSRLTKRNLSSLAATATAASVVGFVVQFIGLRALHWSATIMQLGVTVLMTCVRAYVRRGLATNPICQKMLDEHETADLTLRLLEDNGSKTAGEHVPGESEPSPGDDADDEIDEVQAPYAMDMNVAWEVQTLYSLGTPTLDPERSGLMGIYGDSFSGYTVPQSRFKALFPKTRLNAALDLESNETDGLTDSTAVSLHVMVHKLMPRHDYAVDVAERLARVLERLAAVFAHLPSIQWADADSPFAQDIYNWYVPVAAREGGLKRKTMAARFDVERAPNTNTSAGTGLLPWSMPRGGWCWITVRPCAGSSTTIKEGRWTLPGCGWPRR